MIRHCSPCAWRPARVPIGIAGLVLVGLALVLGIVSPPDPAMAGPVGDQSVNGCTGAVSGRADPSSIRCQPASVTLGVLPSCKMCPGGLRVVFIQREIATESRWMNNEALDTLAAVRQLYPGDGLQAAVIQYGPSRSRVSVAMTDDLDKVRSGLGRANSADNPPDHNNSASSAAREAIKQLKPQEGDDPAVPPCRLVLFFAQDSPTPG